MQAEIVTNVDSVWHLISDRIIKTLEDNHGDCSAGDLWTMCRSGGAFLMVAHGDDGIKGASIWRFEQWLEGTVLKNIILAGEDMDTWFEECSRLANAIGKAGGATKFVWDTRRRGFEKLFPKARPIRQTYMMEIE